MYFGVKPQVVKCNFFKKYVTKQKKIDKTSKREKDKKKVKRFLKKEKKIVDKKEKKEDNIKCIYI